MPTASRERAGQDLLGVGEEIEIPLERLDELQERIDSLDDNKAAYDLAMEMSPEYAMDPRLRMAFLRSVDGSAKKASKRFIRHFQTKLELFGREKLVKHIELSDLDDYDLEALRSGGFQVLPTKDRGGRPILFGRYTCMKYRSIDNMVCTCESFSRRYNLRVCRNIFWLIWLLFVSGSLQLRVLWYLFFCMIEDEEHQASGIVTLGFENGKVPLERFENVEDDDSKFDMHAADGGFDKELARGILRIPTSIPVRFMSFHICADYTHHWQGVFDMVVVTLCKFVRIRLRLHYGMFVSLK